MKMKSLAAMLCAIAGLALVAETALAGDASKRTAVEELKWSKTPFGPMASPVYGDFAKEGHVTYVKFPSGMKTPLHIHSHDYVGVVLSGTTRHYTPGKPKTETLLRAGSHWFMPGNQPHISECLDGEECIMALYQSANFDFKPVN